MFQKPTFGSNATSGFGSFNTGATTATPFGGFKPTTGTFGGATTTQPTTGGGLFSANTTGGMFGSNAPSTSTSAFGANTSGFGFGSTAPSTGLFANNASTGLFGNTQNTSAFGAKPAGFGFGSTATPGTTSVGLFGATPTAGTGLFGQQNNTMSGGGLFGANTATGGFGQQQQPASGTGHVKYNPVVGTDVVVKSGISQNINIKHHCITCMKEYENKSLEELRLEDYTAGRKGSTGGMFGGFQPQPENKPLFGAAGFGQAATTSASSMFGGGAIGTSAFPQTSTFSFSGANQNTTNTSGLFPANKSAFGPTPTPGPLFGATTTQAPTFGTATPSFGFGSNTQNQSRLLFGTKPGTTGFGTTPTSTGFGGFSTGGGIFDAKTTAPAFGTTTPAFGTMTGGGFGTNTSTTGGLFGTSTFGKPATTQPFGFNTQPTGGLGTGLSAGLGTNTFQAKPAATGFGTLGSNTMFQQPATNTFKTGLEGGLGGGLFSNPSTLGNSNFGLGTMNNVNNNSLMNNTMVGASATGNVHEQMLNLAARPYGDSPLFKDLLPDSAAGAEDVLKPTNPTALKAVLERSQGGSYRLTPPTSAGSKLRLQPRTGPAHDKKSLFDGLEESDASLEDKLCLKPSRKRLVLRSRTSNDNSRSDSTLDTSLNNNNTNRTNEETQSVLRAAGQVSEGSPQVADTRDASVDKSPPQQNEERPTRREMYGSDLDQSTERNDSWLKSPNAVWSEKDNPAGWDSTPKLYPNLDKEKPSDTTERRASWLTTRPLRQPLAASGNPDAADNSVRELGLRPDASTSRDKENVDLHSMAEDNFVAPRDMPPHPTGIRLTRPGYYTIPTLDEMIGYLRPDGACPLPHLTIGRRGFGNVYYDYEINVAGLDLDDIVHFLNKEVIIYPEETDKPPVGEGLNRPAVVTLDRIWPRDKTDKRFITDPDRLAKMEYEAKLRRVCEKHNTKFIEYRAQTGSWVFRVEHFSKYGLTDSDEEDDHTPDVLKRQLLGQAAMQGSAPPAPPATIASPGLGGLGPSNVPPPSEADMFTMDQTSLSLINGSGRACEMDTTEENAETQSFYKEHTAYGVKSPTSELARLENRQSHNVQLMKASLYADADMEEDVSVSASTGDQLVPRSAPPLSIVSSSISQRLPREIRRDEFVSLGPDTDEVTMRPLIVRPHTIVLKYHRKIPPFKNTIAGRLDAACIADMSVCRARHSRVGFGPGSAFAYVTSYDSVTELPKSGDHSDVGKYVRGRLPDDWSEQTVARVALGQPDKAYSVKEVLAPHLATLLQWSEPSPASAEELCPRFALRADPSARLSALKEHLHHASKQLHRVKFGVSGSYCYEVWRLCDVLWGADLENDGMPGTDDLSVVNRHKKLLEWFKGAVDSVTESELSKPKKGEKEDEADGHSARVWTLLLGGRVVEACKVARDNGDLNMAMLIAQAAGEPWFRSLVSRQLALWRECGADALVSSHRLATLQMISGAAPLPELADLDWLRALHVTARYLCPQVPTLERVIRAYEGFFHSTDGEEPAETDLSLRDDETTVMQLPLPDYTDEYKITVNQSGKARNVLDLRYELMRARAFNTRPKLRPAAYTPDTMDYTLCFLLGTWFGNPTIESIVGVSEQLESAGAWHLAVQALAYHPNDTARGHLIRSVLSRHAPAKADTPELQDRLGLIRKLGVPEKWILLAQAHRAKYEHLPTLEVEHLVGAEEWNAAHRVLLEDILADVVLADDLQSIAPLLEKLNEAARRHEVSGWETGGQALYHYIRICEEIRGLVSEWSGRAAVVSRLEALRPALAAACRALPALPHRSAAASCARSEMGARLVQLALAAGEPAHTLAALLATLRLPPDCTPHAHHKITTDLAERASEMCLESASSSPLSSHHRATVNS